MSTITQGYLDDPVFSLVSRVAEQEGVRAFVIGGYVRDCFLGTPSKDIDIVVEGSGIALAEAVAEHIRQVEKHSCHVSVFKNFGTAMLRYHGTEVEFVGARKESYHRDSRKPIVEDGTLEEDQLRRDFTINAMAFSLQREDFGALVDPFGGIRDLAAGIIRTPLDPEVTYSDDPLRMLRAIRFATRLTTPSRTFTIVPESLEAMRKMKDRMSILSKERIVEELNKILLTPHPSMGFRLLDETGLLEYILPDLVRLKGVETVEGRGHKDNFSHTLQVVDHVAEDELRQIDAGTLHNYAPVEGSDGFVEVQRTEPYVWLRWAALLHDIGKPASKRYDPVQGWTFHGHNVLGARMVPKIFQSLKMPLNEKMKYVQKLVELHHRPVSLVDDEVTDSAVRRLLFDAGNEIDDLMLLCNADITSKNPVKVARLKRNFELVREKLAEVEAKDAIRNMKNPITGDYVMKVYGIPPCDKIGVLKEYVKNAILDGRIGNNFEEADRLMRAYAPTLGLQEVASE
ncbi:MAG: HD domain-containing protein [Bacteroidales bacterium]|nr:HD domain-containing protein [Bacteroidales bacterium]